MPRPLYSSDSTESSSGNESICSWSSSSSSSTTQTIAWSDFARPLTAQTSHYLSKVQESLYSLICALAGLIDERDDGRGWQNANDAMRRLLSLSKRWTGGGSDVWKRVEIAALYANELLESVADQLEDKMYVALLGSESFKAMVVVLKRLWPRLKSTTLFTFSLTLTNDRIPTTHRLLQPYMKQHLLPLAPTIITRFLAITLQRPLTRFIPPQEPFTEWEALDLSKLGLQDNAGALRGLNWALTMGLLKGLESGVDWREEAFFLVDLSHNGLEFLPIRFAAFAKRTYALDISSNPLVGLPNCLRDRAFDIHVESLLRTRHTQLKNFTNRTRWFPSASPPTPTRGANPLQWHTIKRLCSNEPNRLAAAQELHNLEHPLAMLFDSAYECEQCTALMLDHIFLSDWFMREIVVQLSPSGLAFGGRFCMGCARGLRGGLWPLFATRFDERTRLSRDELLDESRIRLKR